MTDIDPKRTVPTPNVAADQGYGDDDQVQMSPANDPFVVSGDADSHHPFTPPDNADPAALTQQEIAEDETPEQRDWEQS